MVFGFSKSFVFFLFLSAVIAYGYRDIWSGVKFLGVYIIIKIVWRLLTR